MSFLNEIDCFLCCSAHEKSFLEASLMNECLKNELYCCYMIITVKSCLMPCYER